MVTSKITELTLAMGRIPLKTKSLQPAYKAPQSGQTIDLTVIVPAYNEAGFIADTIRSIQSQTVQPKEIIVVIGSAHH